MEGIQTLIIAVGIFVAFMGLVLSLSYRYNLNNIKNKTVGHGQHGSARWATKKEIRRMYKHLRYNPPQWRTKPDSRPKEQGIVVGCKNINRVRFANYLKQEWYKIRLVWRFFATKVKPDKERKEILEPVPKCSTKVMVDTGDVHALMIGAAGVGKTAYWLYPCIEYACATGMSFLSTDTKGDIVRNYGNIASKYYGYNISVIDLRNPTRSNGNNLLHLVNKYMDLFKEHPEVLAYKAKAEKYAKIIAKTIIMSGGDSASYGQNAYFYDAAEGLLTASILLLAEFGEKGERHIVSVYKLIQELLEPSSKNKKNKFQVLMTLLPETHKAKWFAGAALTTSDTTMASVMSTALSRLNAFLDSELEQLLCFDTEIDAEKFCKEKSAIFVIMPEEDPNKFFMVSLLIQQLYREILAVADENGGQLKNRCVFFCDEFGTLPKIESAEMMFSASRSRRLQIVPIIQSFAQLEKNYGKEGADVIIDNTQLTIFGGFAPNSTSAETLSKALGSRTVMSGSVSRSKDNPSQSIQMIERPLMTADELKNLPKGTFVVMKTAYHPMKVKLKLFFKWGITFEEKFEVSEHGNRQVKYIPQGALASRIQKAFEEKKEEKAESDKKENGSAPTEQMTPAPHKPSEMSDEQKMIAASYESDIAEPLPKDTEIENTVPLPIKKDKNEPEYRKHHSKSYLYIPDEEYANKIKNQIVQESQDLKKRKDSKGGGANATTGNKPQQHQMSGHVKIKRNKGNDHEEQKTNR